MPAGLRFLRDAMGVVAAEQRQPCRSLPAQDLQSAAEPRSESSASKSKAPARRSVRLRLRSSLASGTGSLDEVAIAREESRMRKDIARSDPVTICWSMSASSKTA